MTKMLMLTLTLATALTGNSAEPMPPKTAPAKSAVTDICYYPQSSLLKVEMASGRTYLYENVPAALADAFAVAEKKREFYDREISGQYTPATAQAVKQATERTGAPKAPAKTAKRAPTAKTTPVSVPGKEAPKARAKTTTGKTSAPATGKKPVAAKPAAG